MYQSILVPIDGSESSRRALDVARELGPGAVLHLLSVPELAAIQDGLDSWAGAVALDEVRRRAEWEARELLTRTREALEPVDQTIETHVAWGSPARVIVEEAERLGVQAIVMGSRGLSELSGLVVGSVSHRVMHTAGCRVVTVH